MRIMKRCRWIEVVLRPLASRSHLSVVKGDERRREMLRCIVGWLIDGTAEKSIWSRSIQHLIVQMMVIWGINLFAEWSFFGHFWHFHSYFTLQRTRRDLLSFILKCPQNMNQSRKIKNSCLLTAVIFFKYFYLTHDESWKIISKEIFFWKSFFRPPGKLI